MSNKFSGFKYTGGGSLSLPGVPAKNLTYDEVKELGAAKKALLASGIYEEVPAVEEKEEKTPGKKDDVKSGGNK